MFQNGQGADPGIGRRGGLHGQDTNNRRHSRRGTKRAVPIGTRRLVASSGTGCARHALVLVGSSSCWLPCSGRCSSSGLLSHSFVIDLASSRTCRPRSIHLAFAMFLAFAAFPGRPTKFQLGLRKDRTLILAACSCGRRRCHGLSGDSDCAVGRVGRGHISAQQGDRIRPGIWGNGLPRPPWRPPIFISSTVTSRAALRSITQDLRVAVIGISAGAERPAGSAGAA